MSQYKINFSKKKKKNSKFIKSIKIINLYKYGDEWFKNLIVLA
jgi:hypothetical protein